MGKQRKSSSAACAKRSLPSSTSSWSRCVLDQGNRPKAGAHRGRPRCGGQGGAVKSIIEPLNPRGCRIVALGTPSDKEKTQCIFQRYVSHLPAAGEIVLFDRS